MRGGQVWCFFYLGTLLWPTRFPDPPGSVYMQCFHHVNCMHLKLVHTRIYWPRAMEFYSLKKRCEGAKRDLEGELEGQFLASTHSYNTILLSLYILLIHTVCTNSNLHIYSIFISSGRTTFPKSFRGILSMKRIPPRNFSSSITFPKIHNRDWTNNMLWPSDPLIAIN